MKKNLVLIITTRCNFKCKHCLREYYTKQTDLSLPLIKKAIIEAKEMGIKEINLTGGEAILYPKLRELIDFIVSLDLKWSVVTNGSMYKKYDKILDKYQENLKFIVLSLDGGTEKTHDTIREKGSFDKVCEAISYYKAKGIFVKVSFCVNSKNIEEIETAFKLVENLGADSFLLLGTIAAAHNKDLQLTWEQKIKAYTLLNKLKQCTKMKVDHTTSLFAVTDADKFCENINNPEPTINAYGEYIFCCDTIGQGAVLGSLKKESFSELYIKSIKKSNWLLEERRKRIINKDFFKDFNSCNFCNETMKNTLSVHKQIDSK